VGPHRAASVRLSLYGPYQYRGLVTLVPRVALPLVPFWSQSAELRIAYPHWCFPAWCEMKLKYCRLLPTLIFVLILFIPIAARADDCGPVDPTPIGPHNFFCYWQVFIQMLPLYMGL
jgi:hypothetical protein